MPFLTNLNKTITLNLLISLIAACLVTSCGKKQEPTANKENNTIWTCSMHPQIRQPDPGKCPICGMDLIQDKSAQNSDNQELPEITLSENAQKLAQIETTKIKSQTPEAEINLFGKIAWDESRVKTISANYYLRIERLFLDFTGIRVRKGEHLAEVYSPELISAQAELISGLKMNNYETINGARKKLKIWGFSQSEIAKIEQSREVMAQLELRSPISGIVIKKNVNEGDYVKVGGTIFEIADFENIWLILQAYESDLPWLHYGQEVEFTAEGAPGKTFSGMITFISPELNPTTRTIDVRVNAKNPDGMLKVGMFAQAKVKAQLSQSDKIIAPDLANKFICPMHPEIFSTNKADCSICGMALVPAKELGYISQSNTESKALMLPASAPLITGKRAVVYVKKEDKEGKASYEGREVELGARAGDYYIVENGLKKGEEVVTNGAFMLDATLQISAKPSMMSHSKTAENKHSQHNDHKHKSQEMEMLGKNTNHENNHNSDKADEIFLQTIRKYLLPNYFALQSALAEDDLPKSKKAASEFLNNIIKIDPNNSPLSIITFWQEKLSQMRSASQNINTAKNITKAREEFYNFSNALISLVRRTGFLPEQEKIYLVNCPMAFAGKGGDWLQAEEDVANPYFGAEMLRCGSIEAEFPAD